MCISLFQVIFDDFWVSFDSYNVALQEDCRALLIPWNLQKKSLKLQHMLTIHLQEIVRIALMPWDWRLKSSRPWCSPQRFLLSCSWPHMFHQVSRCWQRCHCVPKTDPRIIYSG